MRIKKRRKRLIAFLCAFLLLLIALAGLTWYVWINANRQVEPTAFPPARSMADANRQDLRIAWEIGRVDRSFSSGARASFDRELDLLDRKAPDLDPAVLEMRLSHAFALADNGHTNVRGAAFGRTLPAAPIRMAWFADGLHVIMAEPAHENLLGGRVLAIGSRSPEAVAQILRAYVGGAESFKRLLSAGFMRSPQALHAIGLTPSSTALPLTLQMPSGEIRSVSLPAKAPPPPVGTEVTWPVRYLAPESDPADVRKWRHVLDGASVPLYLSRPNLAYWRSRPAQDLLYIQFRRMRDQDGRVGLSDFLAQTLVVAAKERPRFVVVDLRASPGGNYMLATEFTRRLPELIPTNGQVFILTGPNTFSAAIVVAARLKHFAGARGIMIGEEMGDRANFWAEGDRMELPNSKIMIRYSTAYHDWANGCGISDFFRCYWPNYRDGVAAGSLRPAVRTPLRIADYRRGIDPAMVAVERIADVVRARTGRAST